MISPLSHWLINPLWKLVTYEVMVDSNAVVAGKSAAVLENYIVADGIVDPHYYRNSVVGNSCFEGISGSTPAILRRKLEDQML